MWSRCLLLNLWGFGPTTGWCWRAIWFQFLLCCTFAYFEKLLHFGMPFPPKFCPLVCLDLGTRSVWHSISYHLKIFVSSLKLTDIFIADFRHTLGIWLNFLVWLCFELLPSCVFGAVEALWRPGGGQLGPGYPGQSADHRARGWCPAGR